MQISVKKGFHTLIDPGAVTRFLVKTYQYKKGSSCKLLLEIGLKGKEIYHIQADYGPGEMRPGKLIIKDKTILEKVKIFVRAPRDISGKDSLMFRQKSLFEYDEVSLNRIISLYAHDLTVSFPLATETYLVKENIRRIGLYLIQRNKYDQLLPCMKYNAHSFQTVIDIYDGLDKNMPNRLIQFCQKSLADINRDYYYSSAMLVALSEPQGEQDLAELKRIAKLLTKNELTDIRAALKRRKREKVYTKLLKKMISGGNEKNLKTMLKDYPEFTERLYVVLKKHLNKINNENNHLTLLNFFIQKIGRGKKFKKGLVAYREETLVRFFKLFIKSKYRNVRLKAAKTLIDMGQSGTDVKRVFLKDSPKSERQELYKKAILVEVAQLKGKLKKSKGPGMASIIIKLNELFPVKIVAVKMEIIHILKGKVLNSQILKKLIDCYEISKLDAQHKKIIDLAIKVEVVTKIEYQYFRKLLLLGLSSKNREIKLRSATHLIRAAKKHKDGALLVAIKKFIAKEKDPKLQKELRDKF
ncbi:MAG: hypothetical protein HRT89_10810 [Lentisphaeria bacterium]|nr:hypothetical protein [Lentisphaeria bacterium]